MKWSCVVLIFLLTKQLMTPRMDSFHLKHKSKQKRNVDTLCSFWFTINSSYFQFIKRNIGKSKSYTEKLYTLLLQELNRSWSGFNLGPPYNEKVCSNFISQIYHCRQEKLIPFLGICSL